MIKVIYRRPPKDPKDKDALPAVGTLEDLQVGDGVSYYDMFESARAAGVIEKINVAAGVLRLAARVYRGVQYRPPRKLTVAEIISAERNVPEEGTSVEMEKTFTTEPEEVLPVSEPEEVPPTPEPLQEKVSVSTKGRDPRLPAPGSILEREYKGKAVRVLVQETTFEYDGQVYKSLSKIAAEVTEKSANGFVFFKLC
jgi:hypothetical protein